jgi:predicted small lipoprotein YifL
MRMRTLAAVLFATLAACGGKSAPTTTPADNSTTDTTAETGPTTDVPTGPVVLKGAEQGDRACYISVALPDGTETSLEGSFELCTPETDAMVGQTVVLTYEKGNVLAAECEGDVDCGKSDEVDLVMTITAQ